MALVEALAVMPASLSGVEAAPLLCAGITTDNALRHSSGLPDDFVAVPVSAVWVTSEFNIAMSASMISSRESLRSTGGRSSSGYSYAASSQLPVFRLRR